jgi:hypothetical protein
LSEVSFVLRQVRFRLQRVRLIEIAARHLAYLSGVITHITTDVGVGRFIVCGNRSDVRHIHISFSPGC